MVMLLVTSCCETQKSEKQMTKAIDPANMDLNIKPGDDFFRYVNGTWIANNPIPPEYSQYGAFHVLYDKNQEDLKSLVLEVSADKKCCERKHCAKNQGFLQ